MARGRMLNKKISLNRDVAELIERAGFEAGLIYTWMIAHLDRDGRHHGDPEVIRSLVCPRLSGLTPDQVRTTLEVANELGLINWYSLGNELYLEYPKFRENNKNMKYEREAVSEIPTNSGLTPDLVRTKSPLREVKGREVKGSEEKRKEATRASRSPSFSQKPLTEDTNQVTAHYLSLYPRRKAQAKSATNRRKIQARLKEGYTPAQLCQAIDGNAQSHFHKNNGHNSLELIVRSAEKVDQFLNPVTTPTQPHGKPDPPKPRYHTKFSEMEDSD